MIKVKIKPQTLGWFDTPNDYKVLSQYETYFPRLFSSLNPSYAKKSGQNGP